MTQEDRERMAVAMREAEKAMEEGEIPVGAALFHGDTLLWADHNRREQAHDPTAHAELLCMRHGAAEKGDWRLNDCTLYVTLEPCPMCAGAMVMSRVGRCVFGAADAEKGCCGSIYDLPADSGAAQHNRVGAGSGYGAVCGTALRKLPAEAEAGQRGTLEPDIQWRE